MRLRSAIDFSVWSRAHRLPPSLRERWQLVQLKRVARLAYEHVPFYRTLWNLYGMRPENIKTIADLQKFPIVNKQTFREHPPEDLIHRELRPGAYAWNETSGSTGEPFRFPVNYFYTQGSLGAPYADFCWYRFLVWRGMKFSDVRQRMKIVRITYKPSPRPGIISIPKEELADAPRLMSRLNEMRIDILESRPTLLLEFAERALASDAAEQLKFRYLVGYGETFTMAAQKYLKDVFGAEVYNRYGLEETGTIAVDCREHAGLHLHEESCIVEIVDKQGKPVEAGTVGRVIVTFFYNDALPFFRYDTGDRGTILDAPCQCGLYARRLEVSGRTGGFLTVGGRNYNYSEFQMVLSHFSSVVLRYQLAKVSPAGVELRVIPVGDLSMEKMTIIRSAFQETLGFEPAIKVVNRIPYADSGKTLSIVDETRGAVPVGLCPRRV